MRELSPPRYPNPGPGLVRYHLLLGRCRAFFGFNRTSTKSNRVQLNEAEKSRQVLDIRFSQRELRKLYICHMKMHRRLRVVNTALLNNGWLFSAQGRPTLVTPRLRAYCIRPTPFMQRLDLPTIELSPQRMRWASSHPVAHAPDYCGFAQPSRRCPPKRLDQSHETRQDRSRPGLERRRRNTPCAPRVKGFPRQDGTETFSPAGRLTVCIGWE